MSGLADPPYGEEIFDLDDPERPMVAEPGPVVRVSDLDLAALRAEMTEHRDHCAANTCCIPPTVLDLLTLAEHAQEAEAALERVEALADELLAFDCINDLVPSDVDVPDDFEHGVHDSGRRLRAALTGGSDG